MQHKSAAMVRVLINHYHHGSPAALLEGLPEEDALQVLNQDVHSSDPSKVIMQPEVLLGEKVHYSWLEPVIESFNSSMQPILLSALPRETARSLGKLMGLPVLPPPFPPARRQLLLAICQKFCKQAILPVEFLPETTLTPLVNLSKADLLELIDYLGLYDLADEIRHIVDRVLLKKIYACLTPKKQLFLRNCLHQKEKLKASKIGLVNWKGDEAQLERLLHRRGLLRLSYALSGQAKDFVWHLIYRLDVGRGRLLSQYYSESEVPGISAFLAQQVVNTLNFLKRTSPS